MKWHQVKKRLYLCINSSLSNMFSSKIHFKINNYMTPNNAIILIKIFTSIRRLILGKLRQTQAGKRRDVPADVLILDVRRWRHKSSEHKWCDNDLRFRLSFQPSVAVRDVKRGTWRQILCLLCWALYQTEVRHQTSLYR